MSPRGRSLDPLPVLVSSPVPLSPLPKTLLTLFVLGLALGCKRPVCRVGGGQGKAEMMQWLHLAGQPTGWLQTWGRTEDYRGARIRILAPDLDLLCQAGCEGPRATLQGVLHTHLVAPLKRQPGYGFVEAPAEADYEVHIRVARVKEHHYLEYVSLLPPTDFYIVWFKVVNVTTGKTAFWASAFDFLKDDTHARTYGRLIVAFNDFSRSRD